MKKHYALTVIFILSIFVTVMSCSTDDSNDYTVLPQQPASPVVFDINAVPYPKLSDYNFFEGEMKNLEPVTRVLPYDLNSSLFTDYALKKRFVWMPDNKKATYDSDGSILDFPVGTVLIKNFYYENAGPEESTFIIETRLMIKKESEWVFANYRWNAEQTEALLDPNGGSITMTWKHNGASKTIDYRIPSSFECGMCHKLNNKNTPIGTKPQNLNKSYNYTDGQKNQLAKWKETGYFDNVPGQIATTVNWKDETQPLELRVRSYLDINCAHCHTEGTYCGYTPMDFAFSQTTNPVNLGLCVEPSDFVTGGQEYLLAGGDIDNSLIYFRMNTNIQSEMMPLIGRTIKDEEAIQLMKDYINSLESTCP